MPFLSAEIIRDVFASRPAAGSAGRLFFASDTGVHYRDNGSSWDALALDAAQITSGTLPAARLPNPSASTLGGVESIAAVTHQFLTNISTSGVPAAAQPADADLSLTDITTNNVTISAHGFAPKLPNDATKFFNGVGGFAVPPGSGLSKYSTSWSSQTSVTVTHSLGTTAVIVQVYDSGGVLVIPESVTATSTSVVTLTFGAAFTGSVVVLG